MPDPAAPYTARASSLSDLLDDNLVDYENWGTLALTVQGRDALRAQANPAATPASGS